MALLTLDLCAGLGGFPLGLRLAGVDSRVACYVEREAFCAAHLARQMQAGALDSAPVWSDVATLDATIWYGAVDLVCAGFPCQPHSQAGKRAGTEDHRWLFDDILRIVAECEPSLVFFENVVGLRTSGLGAVLEGLVALGFDAEWDCFTAAAVGAPHLRRRLFVLGAHPDRRRREEQRQLEPAGQQGAPGDQPHGLGALRQQPHPAQARTDPYSARPPLGQQERHRLPAWLADASRGGWWAPEPDLGRVDDGTAHRVDRLHALGNGVVPQVVATAWTELSRRLLT